MSSQSEIKLRPVPIDKPGPARQTYITIRGLSKQFAGSALYRDFSLDIPQGR